MPIDNCEDHPAKCTISDEEYRKLKTALMENEEWKSHVEEWPPTDENGNVYPIWFTVDELNSRGELIDSSSNNYNPFAGNLEPTKHHHHAFKYCNSPLRKWEDRYPDVRYCNLVVNPRKHSSDVYCRNHRFTEHMKSAEEVMQSGLFTQTVDHFYEKLGPWKKLLGWGIFESLMGESEYDFGEEYKERTFDFSGAEVQPLSVDDDGKLTVKVAYPTQFVDPSLSLYAAAMMRVQALHVQPRILEEDREKGEGVMESKSIETAQLTAPPSEHDPSPQEFKTLKTWSEHHLNMPFSRLFKDMEKALKRGGVIIDPEEESDDTVSGDDIVLEIDASGENVQTKDTKGMDPNAYGDDYTAMSQEIEDNIISDGDD